MKIRAGCASCMREFLLDEAFAGTVLPCPSCGAERGLGVPAGMSAEDTAPAGRLPDLASNPDAPPSPPPRAAAAASPNETREVVCPRCKLHFVPRQRPADAARGDRRTVLVVESMECFRDIARDALAPRFEVRTAADLSGARAELARGGVDVIVLARALDGGESGIDLLRAMREKPCPIVIFTDQDESETYGRNWDALRKLGADELVVKGLNAGELLVRKVGGLLGEQED